MRSKRSKRGKRVNTSQIIKLAVILALVVVLITLLFSRCGGVDSSGLDKGTTTPPKDTESVPTHTVAPTVSSGAPVEEPSFEDQYFAYGDPNNYIYPFNTMSADWGAEVYESGFKYFTIPEEYERYGGCFPEVVQVYLWCLCEERGLDYYIMVALIEAESGYQWDACRSGDNSIGYMQIIEKWHEDRIAEEYADINNPYGNIRVGLNFMSELYERYGDWSKALMAYNMGESGAKKLWAKGEYSTYYSRNIIKRAQEIRLELQG